MRISKSTKTSVKASKKSDVGARTADFIRNKLIAKGYTKEEVNSMGLIELEELADQEGIEVVYSAKSCNSSTSSTKTDVKASKKSDDTQSVAARADFYRRELMKCGYTKEEVKNMGIKELRDAYNNCDIDACGDIKGSTSTDKALQHIKAAIDILGKSGMKDDVTKDSIANLGVVMFDLKSKK